MPVAVEPAIAVDEPSAAAVESTIAVVEPAVAQAEPRQDNFGRRTAGPARGTRRAAHIESIRRARLGHHIMTLSNGHIWAENEPGVRRIKAGQDVTIIKVRFRYDMRLESGRRVAVHRVEDD